MPRSPVITDLQPEQSIQRRLAETEEQQRNRPRVSTGAPGSPGAEGAAGKEGHGPGALYKWSTNTENSDPGSGKIKQGGPLGENVIFRISATDLDGNNLRGWINTWDDNGAVPNGYMFMRKRGAPGTFILFKLGRVTTVITDNTTWLSLTEFEKVGGSAEGFANNDEVYIEYFAAGTKGATGSTGSKGTAGEPGGFKYLWQGEQTKSAGGFFSGNKTTPPAVTKLFVGGATFAGQTIKAWMETWDDTGATTDRGIVVVRDLAEPAFYAVYKITGSVTSESEGVSFAVTFVTGSSLFASPALLHEHSLEFYRTGNEGAKGAEGPTGPTGGEGNPAGIQWEYNSATTMENPGTEKFHLNNATRSSVTQIAIRENSAKGGINPSAFLETWDDSTSTVKGYLIMRKKGEPANLSVYQINSMADEGEWDKISVTHLASAGSWASGDTIGIEFVRTGDKGTTGAGPWTPITDSSIKELSPTSFEKVTNVEGDATLRSKEGFTRGCYVTFSPATTNKGFGFGLNVDPATDEGFTGIDYFLNATAAGTILMRENGVEVGGGGSYGAGDKLAITYDGHTVRYWNNGTLLRSVQRTIGSALYMDSWWNQEGGKAENVEFGPMGERGQDFGLSYTYSTTITEAAPGKGFFRFNNATITSATSLYISRYMLPEVAIKGLINAWDDSTSTIKGILTFRKVGDPTAFAAFTVSGTVTEKEAGEWLAITGLVNTISNGTFANNDEVQIEFERTGDKGTEGPTGPTGPQGQPPGLKFKYSTNNEEIEPASGVVKVNNATLGSITKMFVSEKEFAGNGIVSWLEALTASTSEIKGNLTFVQENDPTKWATFNVLSGRIDKGEWETVPMIYANGPGGFENNAAVRVQFERTGDKGAEGPTGPEGKGISTWPLRDVWQVSATLPGGTAAGSYHLGTNGIFASAGNSAILGATRSIEPGLYAVTGKTTKFRLVMSLESNLTAPSAEEKFKLGLYRVSATIGATGGITRGIELIKETGVKKLEASKFAITAEVKEFAIAGAGDYAFVVTCPAIAAASFVVVQAQLYVENI